MDLSMISNRKCLWLWKAHPNFFISLTATAVADGLIGLGYWLGPDQWHSSPAFQTINDTLPFNNNLDFDIIGILLILVSAFLLHYLLLRDRISRIALIAGAGVASLMALGQFVAAADGRLSGAAGPVLWAFFALEHLAQAGEPPENPVSAQ